MHNRLDWSKNTSFSSAGRVRALSILCGSWGASTSGIFSQSVEASAVLWADACWGSRQRVMDANTLNKVICRASPIVGGELDSLTVVSKWMLSKINGAEQHLTLSTMCFTAIEAHSVTDSSHYRAPQEVPPVCGYKRIQWDLYLRN